MDIDGPNAHGHPATKGTQAKKNNTGHTHLLIDSLAAIPALNHMLDNRILAEILIQPSQSIQRGTKTNKVERLVEENSVGHHNGAVGLRLLDGVVAPGKVVVAGAGLQHRELEVQVRVEREQDRERGQDDVADEAGYYVCEGCCDAVFVFG